MSSELLNGTRPDVDAKLMADAGVIPDAFDGGCPADVPASDVCDVSLGLIQRATKLGATMAVIAIYDWLRAHGHPQAAVAMMTARQDGKIKTSEGWAI